MGILFLVPACWDHKEMKRKYLASKLFFFKREGLLYIECHYNARERKQFGVVRLFENRLRSSGRPFEFGRVTESVREPSRVDSKGQAKAFAVKLLVMTQGFSFLYSGGKEREKKKVSAFVCFLTSMYEKLFRLIFFSPKNWKKLLGGRASQGGENNKFSPPQNGMVEEGIPPPPLLLYSTILRRVCTWERALCSARHSTCWRASR